MLNEVIDTLAGALELLRGPHWTAAQYEDSHRDPGERCAWLADRAVNASYRMRPRDISLREVKRMIGDAVEATEIQDGYLTPASTIRLLDMARTRLVAEFMRRHKGGAA